MGVAGRDWKSKDILYLRNNFCINVKFCLILVKIVIRPQSLTFHVRSVRFVRRAEEEKYGTVQYGHLGCSATP